MLWIKIATHRLWNWVRVILKLCSKIPPSHEEENNPMLPIDMIKAKKVPSIPGGQSLALRMSSGIYLSLTTNWFVHSSRTANKWSGMPSFKFNCKTSNKSSIPEKPKNSWLQKHRARNRWSFKADWYKRALLVWHQLNQWQECSPQIPAKSGWR